MTEAKILFSKSTATLPIKLKELVQTNIRYLERMAVNPLTVHLKDSST